MKKKLSIALLAFSLAMLCATFITRRVMNFFPDPQEQVEEEFSPFAKTAQDASAGEKAVFTLTQEEILQEQKEFIKPVLKTELTEEERQTIEHYAQNPKLKAFVEELSTVITPDDIKQGNYLQLAFKPEVRNIFLKYSQDKEFREIAATVMKDKDLLQLAEKLVKNTEVQK